VIGCADEAPADGIKGGSKKGKKGKKGKKFFFAGFVLFALFASPLGLLPKQAQKFSFSPN
jgi:hypothetical protein